MGTIDLGLLTSFVAVADGGSFSIAARRLEIPKSSVSRQVARLEKQLNVRLLHRTTRHVALTTAGKALYEKTAPNVAQLTAALGSLPEREETPSGLLRVTAAVDFGTYVLADIVSRFLVRYPEVQVEMHLDNAAVDLVKEGLDVAIRMAPRVMKDSTLTARRLCDLSMALYASADYLARRGTPRTPEDLAQHEFVVFRPVRELLLESEGSKVTIEPRGRLRCDEMAFAREAVKNGGGVGQLPTFLAESEVLAGRLVRVLPRWSIATGSVWFVSPTAKQQPRKVSAFRDFLAESLKP